MVVGDGVVVLDGLGGKLAPRAGFLDAVIRRRLMDSGFSSLRRYDGGMAVHEDDSPSLTDVQISASPRKMPLRVPTQQVPLKHYFQSNI